MTGEEWRFCKRCLIREAGDAQLYASIKEYLESIDRKSKADVEEYERRLNECRACERLIKGTCTVCGCYVEMRAAVTKNHCPAIHPKW